MAEDRMELIKSFGKSLELKCRKCHHTQKYSIDSIRAKSKYITLISVIILLGGTGALFLILSEYFFHPQGNFGFAYISLLLPLLLSYTLMKNENHKIRTFNKSQY
jgi:hypothetical protein